MVYSADNYHNDPNYMRENFVKNTKISFEPGVAGIFCFFVFVCLFDSKDFDNLKNYCKLVYVEDRVQRKIIMHIPTCKRSMECKICFRVFCSTTVLP